MAGNFNTPQLELNRSGRQKIRQGTVELNNIINLLDIIDIFTLHQTTAEYTLLSSLRGTVTTETTFWTTKHLNIFDRTEIIQCLLSDHNGIKLEINNTKIAEKSKSFENSHNSK